MTEEDVIGLVRKNFNALTPPERKALAATNIPPDTMQAIGVLLGPKVATFIEMKRAKPASSASPMLRGRSVSRTA